jgi:hypothetical protein
MRCSSARTPAGCHEAGTAIGDNPPSPATVPAGRFVYIEEAIPWLIYADKSRKKVVAAFE